MSAPRSASVIVAYGPASTRERSTTRTPASGGSAIRDLLPATALGRPDDRVANLGGAVPVLERRSVGSDVVVVGDRAQEVMDLVHERVLPADDVARRPPPLPAAAEMEHLADLACLQELAG